MGDRYLATGLALAIGLNSVDPKHYGGWTGDLAACEADALDMTEIAKSKGFEGTSLLTREATKERVVDRIRDAARLLKPGDIFMLSYAGHGGQLPDRNEDEVDALDETWLLHNGQLIDDELYSLFGEFAQGVRILVFSDSCHSGTVVRAAYYRGRMDVRTSNTDMNGTRYRFIPIDAALRTYRLNRETYDPVLKRPELRNAEKKVKASVILLSGCQDNQYSADGAFNGLFTSQLLTVWKDGQFKASYRKFHKEIVRRMPPDQTPNYFLVGQKNTAFEEETPFNI